MSKKVIHQTFDDLDNTQIASGGETIEYSVNGVFYNIDLNTKNAKGFHKALDYYISHSTKVPRKAAKPAKRTPKSAPPKQQPEGADPTPATIRAWAAENGYTVSVKGRVAADVREAYLAANS